ncbi:hypothetical protein V2A60_010031 [Cordyceps javanica]|uniref:Uncharacterized protein n=1 Tax=Cordyceps javanica TaxID=43265 RepID=A0A545VTP1_9HYPO|nr:hypothetical protein IF1G_08149 [Cordyceps javanica]TQW05091.1 hypothetical protein IF2G_07028 [Cordyceps javanica]
MAAHDLNSSANPPDSSSCIWLPLAAGFFSATALARNIPHAYPSINEERSRNAGAAIWQVRSFRLSRQACLAVISTVLQESELAAYASPRVPESNNYPQKSEDRDEDSIGKFPQEKGRAQDRIFRMSPEQGKYMDIIFRE